MIAVGDTVLFKNDTEKVIMTENIPRKYQQISYTLDEDEEEQNNKENTNENNLAAKDVPVTNGKKEATGRTRNARAASEKVDIEANIKADQNKLQE